MSIEWTVGAVFAVRELATYYRKTHADWARQALLDEKRMRLGIESFRVELTDDKAAYPYSSKRGWIPFGWISHDPEVLSLTSTCWVMLLDENFNPAYLPGQNAKTELTGMKTIQPNPDTKRASTEPKALSESRL